MHRRSTVIWMTGMSGSGKSTISNLLKKKLEIDEYSVSIIDGDSVRDNDNDNEKLGFGFDDVRINNTRIAHMCNNERVKYDIVIVPVISPYDIIRKEVRSVLQPNFHLIYLKTDILSLKARDPKGLYAAADRGEINDLIGYSDVNRYDEPHSAELVVSTESSVSLQKSYIYILNYINKII